MAQKSPYLVEARDGAGRAPGQPGAGATSARTQVLLSAPSTLRFQKKSTRNPFFPQALPDTGPDLLPQDAYNPGFKR